MRQSPKQVTVDTTDFRETPASGSIPVRPFISQLREKGAGNLPTLGRACPRAPHTPTGAGISHPFIRGFHFQQTKDRQRSWQTWATGRPGPVILQHSFRGAFVRFGVGPIARNSSRITCIIPSNQLSWFVIVPAANEEVKGGTYCKTR